MGNLITKLICRSIGSSRWGRGTSGMASPASEHGTGRSAQQQTQPTRRAAAHDRAYKALQARATSEDCHGHERDMQLAAVEVLKGTSLMEHQELPVAQQAALYAAQEAQDAEAPRLHGHAQTLSKRETALQAAQQAQSEEAALLQRLALSLSQQDSSHQITQRAQSVEAVRLQQLAKSLFERETALQATQKAQSEEAARLQQLALSLSQQERAQLYVRLEAEFFIQDALQKQAGMAQHLADKESMLKHQAAQQLQTKKQLKVRSDRASAREDTLRMCREQLDVMAAALTEKEAELALRESAVAEREARAAEAVQEAEQEAKASLQHAMQLEAALQAADKKHSKEMNEYRERIVIVMKKAKVFKDEKEAVEQRLMASYSRREALEKSLQTASQDQVALPDILDDLPESLDDLPDSLDDAMQGVHAAQDAHAATAAQGLAFESSADAALSSLPQLDWSVVQRAIGGSKPLAAGCHGQVYSAPMAIKIAQGDYMWCLQTEAAATAGIDSPYICKPLFMSRCEDQLAMAMPLAKLGSLSSYLRGPVNEPDVKGFLRIPLSRQIGHLQQLAKALQHCHAQRHIAHLDVKPDNILMMSSDRLQLSDFGCVQSLVPGKAILDQSAEELSCHPFLCPASAKDKAHAGMRDDLWGLMLTAAAMLLPVAPFQRVYDRYRKLTKEDRVERMKQEGIKGEPAQDAWFPFLHLQHTDLEYSIQKELDPAEVKAAFRDTNFPMLDGYLEFIRGWLDSSKFQGAGWAHVAPQATWDAYGWQLDQFRQKALEAELERGITPEQKPLYGVFDVSPKGRTLCLQS